MVACIYHPIDGMVVVEDDEAHSMMASGVWFDSPLKAKAYREKVESEIKEEDSVKVMTLELKKGKKNERK